MRWSDQANTAMQAVKTAFGATDAQMSQLHLAIRDWVKDNPTGTQRFQVGALPQHSVRIRVDNGEVYSVDYGDV